MTTAAKLSAQGTSIASLKGVSLMDPEGLQFEIPGGFLDLSRHLLNEQTLPTLLEHAQSVQLEEARDAMFWANESTPVRIDRFFMLPFVED